MNNDKTSLIQVERIFAAAIDLPREERERHIEQACLDAPDLLAQVRSLVAAHDAAATGSWIRRRRLPGR